MSSEGIHIPYEKLSRHTLQMHYAITSLMEELEAVDWYRQRADDTEDADLKAVVLHNASEEIEHAAMVLEWIADRIRSSTSNFACIFLAKVDHRTNTRLWAGSNIGLGIVKTGEVDHAPPAFRHRQHIDKAAIP